MEKITRVLALVGVLATVFVAQTASAAEEGWYVGAGAGIYTLDIENVEFDEDETILRAVAGRQFGRFLAIEMDYQNLLSAENNVGGIQTEVEANVWGVALRPILPLGDLIDLFAKIGYAWYDLDATISAGGSSLSDGARDSDLTYGVGIDFNIGRLGLRGEVTRLDVEDANVDFISASVLLHF